MLTHLGAPCLCQQEDKSSIHICNYTDPKIYFHVMFKENLLFHVFLPRGGWR